MSSLFERFRGRKEPSSAEIAKERLKLVLVTDRSEVTPEKMREMQGELLEVIKRYVPIDETELQIKVEQRDRKYYLVADIPLQRDHAYIAADDDDSEEPDEAVAEVGEAIDETPGDAAGEEPDTTT